jgi:hypothetical protein
MSRQSPTPPPAAPILVANLAQLEKLEAVGRYAITHDGYAVLAGWAWDLHAALYSLQSDGIRGADAVDIAAIEDLASLLETLRDEQARAAA